MIKGPEDNYHFYRTFYVGYDVYLFKLANY